MVLRWYEDWRGIAIGLAVAGPGILVVLWTAARTWNQTIVPDKKTEKLVVWVVIGSWLGAAFLWLTQKWILCRFFDCSG